MKKAVAIILACCMLISVFTAAVNAQTNEEAYYDELYAAVGAVADKLDPSVIDCLYNATDEGKFFEIQYHNDKYPPYTSSGGVNLNNVYYAEEELLAQIGKIGYYECPNGVRGDVNKIKLGLPYTSVVRVAALDNVDYITLPDYSIKFQPGYDTRNKIKADLKEKAAQMNPDDSITLQVLFAYDELRIYVGINLSKCKTEEERQHYYDVYEANKRACYTAMNEEYKNRLVQKAAQDGITVGNLTYSDTTPWILVDTTVSAIDVLAGYEETMTLTLPIEQPTIDGTEVPSECCTEAPTTAPTEADDDFLGYPIDHWTNNVLIFCNTDGIFTSATVRYIEDGSGVWKSAQMTYGGKNEYNESFWYFTMPSKKCRYYITDGTHRTQEDYFTHETLLFLMNETDENGYYNLCLDSYAANEPSYLYRDKLKERYNLYEYEEDPYMGLVYYKELYYHRDENSEIDWALINCFSGMELPVEYTNVVGNRVLSPGNEYMPFEVCYGIYDVKNDKFVDATSKAAYQYDGFVRAFDEVVGQGRPLGDIDNDDELTVVDVTMIQRCEAQMMEYPATDEFMITYDYNTIHYYSDFNRDGERDIIDATCIQRYLVGMPYVLG